MSFITKRVINGITYIYEITSYRDKNGKPRNKQKCLGKIDKDGAFIPNKKRFPDKKQLPAEIKEVKTISKKFIIE